MILLTAAKGVRAACAVLLCCLVVMPGSARAGDPSVVYQSTETHPFWSASLPENGFGGALLRLLSDAAGVSYSLEYLPIKRFRSSVSSYIVGDPDVLVYKEHRAIFPLFIFHAAFFYYKPHHEVIQFHDIRDLQGHIMGVLRGTIEDPDYFVRKGIRVEESDSEIALLKKLHKGRVDFVILVHASGLYSIRQIFPQEVDDFAGVVIAGSERPAAIMVDISSPEGRAVAQRYSRVIRQTLRSPQYRTILEHHVGADHDLIENFDTLNRFVDYYESTWTE